MNILSTLCYCISYAHSVTEHGHCSTVCTHHKHLFSVSCLFSISCHYQGEKDHADSWLQCEISRYLGISVVVYGSCSIAFGSLVIEREKKWDNDVLMVNKVCSGPRSRMLEPRFWRFECTQSWSDSMIFYFSIEQKWTVCSGTKWYRVVTRER